MLPCCNNRVNKHLIWISLIFFFYQKTFAAAELLVKAGTLSIAGFSAAESDLTTIYGGIAGNTCTNINNTSTCDSCASGTSADACNQTSVYPSMKLSVSFKITKTVSNAVAKLYLDDDAIVTLAGANYTQDTSTVTLETTWGDICLHAGLSASCVGTALLDSMPLKVGVDSDASGDVESDERKSITLIFHYIPPGAPDVTQSYCPATPVAAGIYGVCNVEFTPGDAKVFIDSAIYAGADASSTTTGGSVAWESIAVFPIPVNIGGEAAAYSGFATNGATPVFKTIDTDGNIPDSLVEGDINNSQKYCLVYGTKNKAQNIYKFVTTGVDITKSCVTPSEVAGILDDKHCFISTAAFGSEAAPEVEIFRKFRNQFLLTNFLGKAFVEFYYKISPPIADVISENNYLKTLTRIMLYPFLIFAMMSLKIGFLLAAFLLTLFTGLLVKSSRHFNSKKAFVMMAILFLSPLLRAEVRPEEEQISLPQAQEGLIRIKKDGTYVYDIERPLKKESSRITFGQANNPEITLLIQQQDAQGNLTGIEREFTFEDLYDSASGFIIGYDYERFYSIDHGKLGIQAGIGAMFASGNGRLKADPNGPSTEKFTFVTMPLTLGGVYRFEWKDKQMFAPYASGGGTYVALFEKREDIAMPNFVGSPGFYAAGGILFNVSAIDRDAGFQLDSEYGISNMWVSLELRIIEVNSPAFVFSNQYLNAGLSFDF